MPLNDLSISEEIRTIPALAEAVRTATEVLIDVMGNHGAARASAIWSLVRDTRDQPLVKLVLTDPYSKSVAEFAPDEFESRSQLWWRLYRLWGEHLQRTSQQQLEQLHQSVLQLEDD